MARALDRQGYSVDVAHDGEEGLFLGQTESYDGIVLDLGLPKLDGAALLKQWRQAGRDVPVVILTARNTWSEKVKAFDSGADQYVTKPFRMEELTATLRAAIRRATGHSAAILDCGPLQLDTRSGEVKLSGTVIPLTSHELKVLSYLMHQDGAVVSRSELIEHIYDQDFDRDSNTIEVFVRRLRRKIGAHRIRTYRGRGYRLEAVPEPSSSNV
ncbi:MAG: response regulator transcription factor [Alphaproteobacteria bacterium]|nr:response regulator transcription factor [Alphaproteobacteria bacterium]